MYVDLIVHLALDDGINSMIGENIDEEHAGNIIKERVVMVINPVLFRQLHGEICLLHVYI